MLILRALRIVTDASLKNACSYTSCATRARSSRSFCAAASVAATFAFRGLDADFARFLSTRAPRASPAVMWPPPSSSPPPSPPVSSKP
eukprot:1234340-Prymnesium_polylepis.4